MKTFGAKLRAVRAFLGISQTELAQKINLGQYDISALEHGKTLPAPTTLTALEKALGVDFNAPIIIPVDGELQSGETKPSLELAEAA